MAIFGSGFMQPRGPGTIPKDFEPFGLPQMPTVDAGQIEMPQPKRKGGMFGAGKGNFGEIISAALNGYLAARGNPVGMAGLQMLHQRRRDDRELQLHQKQREEQFEDFVRREAWQLANKPQNEDEFTAMMRRAGVDPNSAEGQAAYQTAFQNKINPFVSVVQQNPDGSETRNWMRPPMMGFGQPAIGSVVEDPRKAGGPMPSASGGFPGPY